ncbi:cscB [Symbiodinium sp. CCMP2592]|nr:cscB [Symbiodinium sp. CCMP2592]
MSGEAGQSHTPLWTLKACQLLGAAAWACFGRFINVFWSDIGVTRAEIGALSLATMVASFIGAGFWSLVTDRLGEFKRVLVGTSLAGTILIFLYLLPGVQASFWWLALVCVSSSFFLSTGGPIIDAMCLSVLKEQESEEQYGDQRLWCAVGWGGMSLVAGQLIDLLGIGFMFWGFASIQACYLAVCLCYMPMQKQKQESAGEQVTLKQFLNFDVMWFFANLIIYGLAMSVVESFLLVFLNEDFDNAPKLLLGASTTVMCIFEVPVFKYIDHVWARRKERLTSVLMACKLVLAFRCFCYTLLPPSNPWLVLLIEPLHGFTFAAMWSATVEYGQRIAPPGCVARMQALVNGIYYQIAMGIGTAMWGPLAMAPPKGLGFQNCFRLDAAGIIIWGIIFQAGILIRRRSQAARGAGITAEQPLTEVS